MLQTIFSRPLSHSVIGMPGVPSVEDNAMLEQARARIAQARAGEKKDKADAKAQKAAKRLEKLEGKALKLMQETAETKIGKKAAKRKEQALLLIDAMAGAIGVRDETTDEQRASIAAAVDIVKKGELLDQLDFAEDGLYVFFDVLAAQVKTDGSGGPEFDAGRVEVSGEAIRQAVEQQAVQAKPAPHIAEEVQQALDAQPSIDEQIRQELAKADLSVAQPGSARTAMQNAFEHGRKGKKNRVRNVTLAPVDKQ